MQLKFTHYKNPQVVSDSWQDVVASLTMLRMEKGMSQEALASKIGCATSLIHKWERMKRVPSSFLFVCWLDALGAEIEIKIQPDR